MRMTPLLSGDEIKSLIPQREPILMVDKLFSCTEGNAVTGFTILFDNIFCNEGKTLSETGLIEHVAQSAAAFAGYQFYTSGEQPKLGYIGDVRNFRINWQPEAGDDLITYIRVLVKVDAVTKIEAETYVDDKLVAECQMKIFLNDR